MVGMFAFKVISEHEEIRIVIYSGVLFSIK